MAHEFFPYPASSEVVMNVDLVGVTAVTTGKVHDLSHCRPQLPPFKVVVEAAVEAPVIKKVFDSSEHGKPPASVVLRVLAIESRQRRSIPMQLIGKTYKAELAIDPAEWFGDVTVEVAVLRAKSLSTPSKFASDKGSVVMYVGAPEVIRLDESKEETAGKGLNSRWEDFSDPLSAGHPYQNELYVIDASKNPPELVLNESLAPQVRPIIDGLGTHGLRSRVRDVSLAVVASTAIAALLSEALFIIAREPTPSLDNLQPWQESLVKLAAPIFYPGVKPDQAVPRLLSDLQAKDHILDVIRQKVPLAAQSLSKTAAAVRLCAIEAVNDGQ